MININNIYKITTAILLLVIIGLLLSKYVFNENGYDSTSIVQEEIFNSTKAIKDQIKQIDDANSNLVEITNKLNNASKYLDSLDKNDSEKAFEDFKIGIKQVSYSNSYEQMDARGMNLCEFLNRTFVYPIFQKIAMVGLTYESSDSPSSASMMHNNDLEIEKKAMINQCVNDLRSLYFDYYGCDYNLDSLKSKLGAGKFTENTMLEKTMLAKQILMVKVVELQKKAIDSDEKKKQLKEKLEKIGEEMKNVKQSYLDRLLIIWALPIFGIIAISLLVIPTLYKNIKSEDGTKNDNQLLETIFSNGLLLQLFTVFILTVTILLLGISSKIQNDVLGTLLGGISVYVLQNSFNKNKEA